MKNKLAIVYGSAILLLVLIHIFTFFSNRKSDKPTVPAVSVETLMNALNVHCFAFDIEFLSSFAKSPLPERSYIFVTDSKNFIFSLLFSTFLSL